MIRHSKSLHWLAPREAPYLLPVKTGCPALGVVLLMNAARRAFVGLLAHENGTENCAEPDWQAWLEAVVQGESLRAEQLLTPETHVTCRLLEELSGQNIFDVRHTYRRAFSREILANRAIYFGFFEDNGVAASILQGLHGQCEYEALLIDLEGLASGRFEKAAHIGPAVRRDIL